MSNTTKTKKVVETPVEKATPKQKIIIISSHKQKSKEMLTILGEAYKIKSAPLCEDADVEIVTELPNRATVKDAVLIGNMIPNYLATAAKLIVEANATGFFGVPDRFATQLSAQEAADLLTYPKAYQATECEVEAYVEDGIKA